MVGKTSVTRGEASPAPSILDSASKPPRRSSSRASRIATRELELNPSQPSRSAYSLPPTPITSSFEEALSSTQRATRHRSVNYYEKTPQTKGAVETPNQKNTTVSAQPSASTSRRSSRSRKSDNPKKEIVKTRDSDSGIPSSSNLNPNPQPKHKHKSQSEQSTLHSYLQKKPQDRRKSLATQLETPHQNRSNPDTESSNMGAVSSTTRKTRKSMSANLDDAKAAETDNQVATHHLSTPLSRKDRKSRSFLHSDRISTSTPQSQSQNSSTSKVTKVKPTDPVTPSNVSATKARRRDRKSAQKDKKRRLMQYESSQQSTATDNDTEDHKPAALDSEKGGSEADHTEKKPSNTVTLNLGRKSLESFVQKSLEPASYDHEIADSVEGTPVHVHDDSSYHFDYDTDMYRNNFGLDGHIDTPASPRSFTTTTSAGNRTSGRTRKPTIRALESIESEKRFRRPPRHPTPGKAGSPVVDGTGRQSSVQKPEQSQKATPAQSTSAPSTAQRTAEVGELAKRIFELAAAALSDDFTPAPEADTWIQELRKSFETKGSTAATAVEVMVEGESEAPSNNKASEQWTDEDGWTHTGKINEFGEEYLIVGPEFEWYRPNNTYGDKDLPQPPVRLRSLEQSAKDRIFGYPPRIGERNLPRAMNTPFIMENVYEERAKIRAREEARQRGIPVDRSLSYGQIEALLNQHHFSGSSQPSATPVSAPTATPASAANASNSNNERSTTTRSRKRRRTEPAVQQSSANAIQSSEVSQKAKRRRKDTVGQSTPAPPEQPPASERPKTLKLKLSKKRPHSEVDTNGDTNADPRPTKSPKTSASDTTTTPRRLLKLSTPKQAHAQKGKEPDTGKKEIEEEKPENAPTSTPNDPASGSNLTPGGRPRRRAAAALMAEFQNHAEERARRANARKKIPTEGSEDPGNSTQANSSTKSSQL
ncbi:hypothetical protein BDV25DRAFT_165380 [Aspergillus avenaceus]|uniref:GPI-anchored cell surface glycoprotein n=1 Tax=Aspergillus avenaceus TaxID=36643 RepID=A0A5N6TFL5_ASPAV|nr:hypothetical protein BDV25DRAFT_165380 [Aspergillus avenaceus]